MGEGQRRAMDSYVPAYIRRQRTTRAVVEPMKFWIPTEVKVRDGSVAVGVSGADSSPRHVAELLPLGVEWVTDCTRGVRRCTGSRF